MHRRREVLGRQRGDHRPTTTYTTTIGPGCGPIPTTRGFDVEHNYFASNQGEGFIYEISYNLRLVRTTPLSATPLAAGPQNWRVSRPRRSIFPSPAPTTASPGPYGNTLAITATRSPTIGVASSCGRTPTGTAATGRTPPRVTAPWSIPRRRQSPQVAATAASSTNALLRRLPLEDPERPRQHGMSSPSTRPVIGPDCTPDKYCGFNGIFSQWGSWVPFHGTVVETTLRLIRITISCRTPITGPGGLSCNSRVRRWAGHRGGQAHISRMRAAPWTSAARNDMEGTITLSNGCI